MKKKWLAVSFFLVFTLLTMPVFRFAPNVKAQELKPLKIYRDIDGNYYFKTLSNDTVYLTPFIRLNRWKAECHSRLNFSKILSLLSRSRHVVFDEAENKLYIQIKFLGKVYLEIVLYPLNITEYGALEFEIKVYSSVVFDFIGENLTFPFPLHNLKAYYQPPLYREYGFTEPFSNSTFFVNSTHVMENVNGTWITTSYRPENIVDSYAVYHAYKANGKYKTGKAFHIYRPKAFDSAGNEVWCGLKIAKGLMTVTIPQEFLDKAVYPVTIDPTFGYTTIGGSTQTWQASSRHVACVYNLPEDGDATSISAYIALQDTGTASGKGAIYDLNATGHPNNRVGLTNSNDSITETFQWYEFTFASAVSLTAADYGLCVKPTATWNYKYDSGDTDQLHYNGDYNPGDPYDPWPGCKGHYSQKMSIYCTYTTGGAQEKSFTLTETAQATASHVLKEEKQFTTSPTASATSTLAWGMEKLLQFQTSPSASSQFTLLKEGFYTATELVNTLASYILGKETTLTVKEYVKTETAQANAAYTILLEKLFFQTATPAASALANMGKEATEMLHEFLETAHAHATMQPQLYTPTAETNLALVLAAFAAAIAIIALSLTITKKD